MEAKTRKRLLNQGDRVVAEAFDTIYSLIDARCQKETENPRTVNGTDYDYWSLAEELPGICEEVLLKYVPRFSERQYQRFFSIAYGQEPNFNDELQSADNLLSPDQNLPWEQYQLMYGN